MPIVDVVHALRARGLVWPVTSGGLIIPAQGSCTDLERAVIDKSKETLKNLQLSIYGLTRSWCRACLPSQLVLRTKAPQSLIELQQLSDRACFGATTRLVLMTVYLSNTTARTCVPRVSSLMLPVRSEFLK